MQPSAEHDKGPEQQAANAQAGGALNAGAPRDRKLVKNAVDFWLSIVRSPR